MANTASVGTKSKGHSFLHFSVTIIISKVPAGKTLLFHSPAYKHIMPV